MPRLIAHLLLLLGATVSIVLADDDDKRYNANMCRKSFPCGAGVDIHYPFFLANATATIEGSTAFSSCGYPGMAIACDEERGRATLPLGNRNYTVLDIDYGNHTATVVDAAVLDDGGDCPVITHNVTVPSETWLNVSAAANDDLVFFFDCVFTPAVPQPPNLPPPINCSDFVNQGRRRDGGTMSSYVVPEPDLPQRDELPRACSTVFAVPVLKSWLLNDDYFFRLHDDGYGKVLKRGFQLTWDPSAGPCYDCEESGGQCSYNQVGEFLGCLCRDGRVRNPDCGPRSRKIVIGTSVAAGFLFLVLVIVSVLYIRKRRREYKVTSSSRLLKHTGSDGRPRSKCSSDLESGSVRDLPTHQFTYEELEDATAGFSDEREIGDGGFGTVYRGHLRDGRVVAVKRLYNNSCRRVEQFVNEAAILSRLRHPNLVTFYGCTSSRSRALLLVYEFVSNGTVADHLHGRRAAERALAWPLRLDIAVEAAAALAYLHAVEPPVVHRDVKTTNILLDADFHVKVADFGLSRLFPLDATHVSTAPQGTPGYVDPEYHRFYQLTDRSDVYSFGVVLAELVSSKPAVDVTRDRSEINLAGMAVGRIQRGEVDQLVDRELGFDTDQMTRRTLTMVAELAFRCLQQNGEMRPPIREVLDALRSIQQEVHVHGFKKEDDALVTTPRSPDTVHAPWDSRSTTPSVSQ